MPTVSACPKCSQQVTIPDGVPGDIQVRCPLCDEEYSLSEALATIPPALIPVDPVPVGAGASMFAVGAVGGAANTYGSSIYDMPGAEDFADPDADTMLEDDDESLAEKPAMLGVNDNHRENAGELDIWPNMGAAPTIQTGEEVAFGGPMDTSAFTGFAAGGNAQATGTGSVTTRPRRKRKKKSLGRELMEGVLGAIVGLTIGYYIGNWYFTDGRMDILEIWLPGVAHTEKHRPDWAKFGGDEVDDSQDANVAEEDDNVTPEPKPKKPKKPKRRPAPQSHDESQGEPSMNPGLAPESGTVDADPQPQFEPQFEPQLGPQMDPPPGEDEIGAATGLSDIGAPDMAIPDIAAPDISLDIPMPGAAPKPAPKPVPEPTTDSAPEPDAEPQPQPEGFIGPKATGTFTSDDLSTALRDVNRALARVDISQPTHPSTYKAMCLVGHQLALAGKDDAELAERKSAAEQAAKSFVSGRGRYDEMGRLATETIDSGQAQGVLMTGLVRGVRALGKLNGAAISLPESNKLVTIMTDQPLKIKTGDKVMVLGTVVEKPAENIAGYPAGTAKLPMVVWVGIVSKLE